MIEILYERNCRVLIFRSLRFLQTFSFQNCTKKKFDKEEKETADKFHAKGVASHRYQFVTDLCNRAEGKRGEGENREQTGIHPVCVRRRVLAAVPATVNPLHRFEPILYADDTERRCPCYRIFRVPANYAL